MDRKQAQAIVQAILEPDLKAQDALVHKRAEEAAKLTQLRRRAWLGLAGFAIGAAIGHFAFGRVSYGGLIGLFVGMLVGVLVGRISRMLPTPQA